MTGRPLRLPAHDVAELRAYLDRAAEHRAAGRLDQQADTLRELSGYLRSALDVADREGEAR